MRYFKDTVPVKILFPTMSHCQVSYSSLPGLHMETHSWRESLSVDVSEGCSSSKQRQRKRNKAVSKHLYRKTKIFS